MSQIINVLKTLQLHHYSTRDNEKIIVESILGVHSNKEV